MVADPADESGWCLSTLHDFGSTTISNGAGLAQSPDGSALYYAQSATIKKIDLSDYSISTLGTIGSAARGLACDSSGNVYAIATAAGTLSKITSGGSVTDNWFTPPGSWKLRGFFGLSMGRDGYLYAIAQWISHSPGWTVFRVSLAGVGTQVTGLDAPGGVGYDGVAAESDGTVWVILDPPPVGGNLHVNTTLRRCDLSGCSPSVTDIAIQELVSYSDDGDTEAYGGLHIDADDHLMVPMVTFGGGVGGDPDLSWFLRVAPDGTATRVAGTWDYGGSPPPAATSTNVADGPLGTSLSCENDAAAGISQDGRTLYFIDHTDLGAGGTNLLRTLALCRVFRMGHMAI